MGRNSRKFKPQTKTKNISKNPIPDPQPPITVQPKSNLKDSLKQGMATGVGFGVANAATQGLINSMGKNSNSDNVNNTPQTPNDNSVYKDNSVSNGKSVCHKYMEVYSVCIENNPQQNCNFLLDEFKKCYNNIY